MLIRLSQTPTTSSMLSTCANVKKSWSSTCSSETICRSLVRFRSSSACFRTRQHVRHTLSARDGATASPVPTAERPANPIATPLAPVFFVAGRVATKLASRPARSWSARTRRSRFGSGRPLGCAAIHPECRPSSSSGRLGLSRYETAFQILHKLRARHGAPEPGSDRGKPEEHVEAERSLCRWAYPRQGERRTRHGGLVAGVFEVCQRKQQGSRNKRRTER